MMSEKNWVLHISPNVFKVLKKFPIKDSTIILNVADSLSENMYVGDIKKLGGGENIWRRRVGSYRIFYKIKTQEKIVLVFDVERRSSNTY